MSRRSKPVRHERDRPALVNIECGDGHKPFAIARAEVWANGDVSFDSFGPESVFVDVEGSYINQDVGELVPHTTRTFACARCSRRVPVRSDKEAALFNRLVAGGVLSIQLRDLAAIL